VELVRTPSQTSGPMFGFSLLFDGCDRAVDPDDPAALAVTGSVYDGNGDYVAYPHGFVEVWEGSQWARCRVDEHGRFRVTMRRPISAPAPDGGSFAPHFNIAIFAVGLLKHVLTRVYLPDEVEANEVDPVLAAVPESERGLLIGSYEDGALSLDVHLQGPDESVFFAY
jgi:protocatechuate 3,4-dioxygenase, alpha subunit